MSPEDRTSKTRGRFNEGIGWWSGLFSGVKHKLQRGDLPNDNIGIAKLKPANFIIYKKLLRVNPRSNRCKSWYFISEQFFSVEILDGRFCTVVGRASRVLGEDWKSAFAELFVFALRRPTSPTGVEGRTEGSAAQESKSAFRSRVRVRVQELVAQFLPEVSLMGIVRTEEKSK